MLMQGAAVAARNRLFLPLFKELKWPAPRLKVRLERGRAVFTSETFAWGVCLDLDGQRPLADNFFDVYPGIPHEIPWRGAGKPKVLFVGNLL
jgi:beta-mannosidase